jgi:K+/H+ antiporter YhaU regulatory subunit KhtT
MEVTRPIVVEGQALSLARLNLTPLSLLAGLTIGQIEARYDVSVVLLRRKDNPDIHPAADRSLEAGDVLAVLGGPAEIGALLNDNASKA